MNSRVYRNQFGDLYGRSVCAWNMNRQFVLKFHKIKVIKVESIEGNGMDIEP